MSTHHTVNRGNLHVGATIHKKGASVPTPKLIQLVDETRPRKLADNPRLHGKLTHLHYIYLDNAEEVLAPPIWQNRPPQWVADSLRSQALRLHIEAAQVMCMQHLAMTQRENIRDEKTARAKALEERALIHDQRAVFMIYGNPSAGLPEPDRINYARTKRELELIAQAEAQDDHDLSSCEAFDEWRRQEQIQLYALQRAYFFDTSDIHSADECRLMTADDIERQVQQDLVWQEDVASHERMRA